MIIPPGILQKGGYWPPFGVRRTAPHTAGGLGYGLSPRDAAAALGFSGAGLATLSMANQGRGGVY